MTPITWAVAAELLLKYGPEVVDLIIRKANAGAAVTPEEWLPVHVLADKTPHSQLEEAFARAGISQSSPEAQALLAMLK